LQNKNHFIGAVEEAELMDVIRVLKDGFMRLKVQIGVINNKLDTMVIKQDTLKSDIDTLFSNINKYTAEIQSLRQHIANIESGYRKEDSNIMNKVMDLESNTLRALGGFDTKIKATNEAIDKLKQMIKKLEK